jgi:hypothetical protein
MKPVCFLYQLPYFFLKREQNESYWNIHVLLRVVTNSDCESINLELLHVLCQTNWIWCSPPHTGQLHVALKCRRCYILQKALYNTAVSTFTLQLRATAAWLRFLGHFNKHLLRKSINRCAVTLGLYFHKDTWTLFLKHLQKLSVWRKYGSI